MIGTLLSDRYRIEAKLGEGGMGEVYLAADTQLGRKVALKVLPGELTRDEERVRRFEREALTAGGLNHPNIVTIYEVGQAEGTHFIATELVEGTTVRTLINQGPIELSKLLDIGVQTAEALAAAHRAGVVHRDIKPENIMVRPDGYVKLLDFGLAKLLETTTERRPTALTVPGMVVGTMQYMSPEQTLGDSVDHRTDIFSLGCVLYETATGRHPFRGETFVEVLHKITNTPADRPRAINPTIPAELERIIDKSLAKDPGDRYQHADDLATDLRRLKRSTETGVALGAVPSRKRRTALQSLAVLPFANAGDDPDAEYLGDGITEYVINTLSSLPKLRVMARSTVFRFKGQTDEPRRIGRELGVAAVLIGRVAHRGDALTIGVELVDVAGGWQLWGQQYNRTFTDIFAVQEEIAREISDRLAFRLTSTQKARLARRYTKSAEVYQTYLKALFHMNKRTTEGRRKAIEILEEAIALEPDFAPAYAGLAEVYTMLGFGAMPVDEAAPKAKAAAIKALELDDSIAEVYTSLALAQLIYDRDWRAAERNYRRAIELNPGYAPGRRWYGVSLTAVGRHDDAVAQIRRAQELDPLSIPINSEACVVLFGARRYGEALEQCRRTLELEPQAWMAQHVTGLACEQLGRYEEAIAALKQAYVIGEEDLGSLAALGHVYATAGRRDEAVRVLAQLQEKAAGDAVSPHFMAIIYAGLGQIDAAIGWLEQSYGERSVRLVELKADPRFDPLRHDPRYQDLMRRAGLPG
jgi:serine/threonine protein kinase/Tfp pilus assembly protein PilF